MRISRKRTCNFDFSNGFDAEKLLAEFYSWELTRDVLDVEVLNNYCKEVVKYMVGNKPFLIITGDTGCGKTTMLNAICKMIGYLYYSNVSGTGTELDRRAFQWDDAYTIADWAVNDRSRYGVFMQCEWAAIDDMGQEPAEVSNYGTIIYPIRDILLYRYEHNLVTVITTNKTPKDLTEYYGPRVGDRLAEVSQVLLMKETSYRRL